MNLPHLIPTAKTRATASHRLFKRGKGAGRVDDSDADFVQYPLALSKSIKHVFSVASASIGMNVRALSWLICVGVIMNLSQNVLGMASVTQVAYTSRPVAPQPGWPEGTLALINDPVRTVGWNPWFSELPNDVNYYGFEPRNMDDVNRLIQKLAAIKGAKVHLRLNPNREAARFGYTSTQWHTKTAAVLALGNQDILDKWFDRLPEVRPAVRKFGVTEYRKPPVALLPTLTLQVGQPLFDLDLLKVPPGVVVEPDVSPSDRKAQPDSPTIKAIDSFVTKRNSPSDRGR